MKELSIEEKAKRYDEALEKAKEYHKFSVSIPEDMAMLESIFPELKESEDERIRKILRERIIRYDPNNEILIKEEGISQKQFLAWLEKQGKDNMGISEATKKELEDNLNKALQKETPESWNEFLDEQGEQKHAAWSEEDEKIKESIITGLEMLKDGASDKSLIALYNKKIDWLKFLKDRYTWKPSEEQMDALESAIIDSISSIQKHSLESLYNELKKLF